MLVAAGLCWARASASGPETMRRYRRTCACGGTWMSLYQCIGLETDRQKDRQTTKCKVEKAQRRIQFNRTFKAHSRPRTFGQSIGVTHCFGL